MRREKEPDKASNRRRGARHHIATRRIEQLTKRHILVRLGGPRGDKMNRRIDANSKRHRNHNHIVNADFSKFKEVRQTAQKPKRKERAHAKRDTARQEIFRLAERNDKRTENDENNDKSKPKAILLHGFYHVGQDKLRRERPQFLAIEIPVGIAFLETVQRLGIPTREVAVNKANLSVASVFFTKQIESPGRNIFCGKRFFDLSQLAERRHIHGIFAFRAVKNAGFH